MASTREERLQMRQRGAGTRKIQQVDFGFSFEGPAIGVSDSASIPQIPEPAEAPQIPTAPTAATLPNVASQSSAPGEQTSQRTPGSARNKLPQRPSTYDIPSDDGPREPRSNKKRKLNPPSDVSGSPSRGTTRKSPNRDSPARNGGAATGEAPRRGTTDNAPQPQTASVQDQPIVDKAQATAEPVLNGARASAVIDEAPSTTQDSRNDNTTASEPGAATTDSAQQHVESQRETQPSIAVPETAEQSRRKPRKSRSPPQINKAAKEAQDRSTKRASPKSLSPASQRDKTSKNRNVRKPGVSNDAPEAGAEPIPEVPTESSRHDPETEEVQVNTTEQTDRTQRPSRTSKKSRAREEVEPNAETSHDPENAHPEASRAKRVRGRSSLDKSADTAENPKVSSTETTARATDRSSGQSKRKGRKVTKTAEAQPGPEAEDEGQGGSAEPAHASGKARKESKRSARKATKQSEAQPELEAEPEVEVDAQAEEPEENSPKTRSGPSKPRRANTDKKSKQAADAQTTTTEEQPEQAGSDVPQRTSRKPREPRGETVPVTVHRLANTSAFGTSHPRSDEEGELSADEPSGRQKTKVPNRGGVNPADVLGQICRETLEKTLATLKNGIDNELNQNKRAEWTRKRRAVEAFGTELDGRLLDLSQMLDSNYVLGVELKKAKREMMDLRGHLYKVRKEREDVALQMDAVRAKHMEEENAKTARITINNSLHSLELALDRNRAPSAAEPFSTDLDFMLRTVADDVSSRAPGAQGGLLSQIRAFNEQLESTARRLERP